MIEKNSINVKIEENELKRKLNMKKVVSWCIPRTLMTKTFSDKSSFISFRNIVIAGL